MLTNYNRKKVHYNRDRETERKKENERHLSVCPLDKIPLNSRKENNTCYSSQ